MKTSGAFIRRVLRAAEDNPNALDVLRDYLLERGIDPKPIIGRFERKPLVVNADELAAIVGASTWDQTLGQNYDWVYDTAWHSLEPEEREDDERVMAAQEQVESELFDQYNGALQAAAERALADHGMLLVPRSGPRSWDFDVVPEKNWRDVARKVLETINGVGYFSFSSLQDFLDSGPYTPREAVAEHLHYIKRYPEVYGTTSYRRIFERSWR